MLRFLLLLHQFISRTNSASPLVYVTTKSREIASTTSTFSCEQDFERSIVFFYFRSQIENNSYRKAHNHPEDSLDKDDDNGELLLDTDAENETPLPVPS